MSIFDNVGKFVSDNSPAILTAVGITGLVSTAYLSALAGYKVGKDETNNPAISADRTPQERIQEYWKVYIPAAAVGAVSVTALIFSNTISARRITAITGLYSLTDAAFAQYKAKTIETIGKSREQHVRDEIVKDTVTDNPPSREVMITSDSDVLVYEPLSGRYFSSNINSIKSSVNEINARLINDMYASLNDFYELLGLPYNDMGSEVGWRSDRLLEVDFASHMTADGRPCIKIDYRVTPIRGYYKLGGY